MPTRQTWREKLERDDVSKIVPVPPKWRKRYGNGRMLLARPRDVDALIRLVRKGKLTTVTALREKLAADRDADVTCPLTTGIFIRIAAEAANEERQAGKTRITPYWRVLRADGTINEKLPGGVAGQARLLRAEGHKVSVSAGAKKAKVVEFEKRLTVFR